MHLYVVPLRTVGVHNWLAASLVDDLQTMTWRSQRLQGTDLGCLLASLGLWILT